MNGDIDRTNCLNWRDDYVRKTKRLKTILGFVRDIDSLQWKNLFINRYDSAQVSSLFLSLFHCSTTPLTCRSTDSYDFWTDAVADLIMWKNRRGGFLLLGSTTLLWFLFEKCGYSFFPFVVNTQLLSVVILFLWAKSAILFNRYHHLNLIV